MVARYHVSESNPDRADAKSGEVLLTVEQPASNHNGGQLAVGPDGYLYIGTGDGGVAHDPWDHAENLSSLLGKMLRLDVREPGPPRIPEDNPFVERDNARPEIWAYGLRNPWRFSFDRGTGDLYIADVGQNEWEEIDVQPASSRGGEHYGWDTMEGRHCHEPALGCDPRGMELPVATYDHDEGCSVTGGYVYRGDRMRGLVGTYLFGDYCSGRIWGLRKEKEEWRMRVLLETDLHIASFGEGEDGTLYVLDLGGGIHRVVPG